MLKKIGFWLYKQPSDINHTEQEDGITLSWPVEDPNWDQEEKKIVLDKLQSGRQGKAYKGSSVCRLCGIRNGSSEMYDSRFLWPNGFIHYVEDHNVKPPQDFIDYCIKK